jgi:hypothetical protein
MKINTLLITLAIGLQSMIGFSQDYYFRRTNWKGN